MEAKQSRLKTRNSDAFEVSVTGKQKGRTNAKRSVSPSVRVHITKPEDTWLITSFFNIKIDYKFLEDSLVENLFKNADFNFFLNKRNDYLFTTTSELIEHDFGKLHPISAIEALKKFGLKRLEDAKEKSFVRI